MHGEGRGKGGLLLYLHRINIRKMNYFLTKMFQHSICVKLCQRLSLSRLSTKPQAHLCTHSQVVDVLVPVNGDRKISVSNEHTSTPQFYTRFLSILTKFFQRHQNTLFWPGTKKKFSQRVGRGQRFFGCEKHFNFFSSFEIGNVAPICIQLKNSLLYLPKWVGKVVFAEPQSSPKCLVIH